MKNKTSLQRETSAVRDDTHRDNDWAAERVNWGHRSPVANPAGSPYKSVVRIEVDFDGDGTIDRYGAGVLIGDNDVLTSSWLLWRSADGFAKKITVTAAQNGAVKPYGDVTVTSAGGWDSFRNTRLHVPDEYTAPTRPHEAVAFGFGIGVINLPSNLGSAGQAGHLPIARTTLGDINPGASFTLATYSSDMGGGQQMYTVPIVVDSVNDYADYVDHRQPRGERVGIEYFWDSGSVPRSGDDSGSSNGNIGSPIVANVGGVPTVAGVHGQDRTLYRGDSHGTPLVDYFYDRVTYWANDTVVPPSPPPTSSPPPPANDGDDLLYGTSGNDLLHGFLGNDTLYGGDGNDTLHGDGGNDLLMGNTGNDLLHGDAGNDTLYGGKDRDTLHGDDGDDLLMGNIGDDLLHGGAGNDTLYGGKDQDTLHGDDGNDLLMGNIGDDLLHGDAGNDTLYGGKDRDTLHGDDGNDLLMGNIGDDLLHGDDGSDTLYGGKDRDTLHGDGGDDLLHGDLGDDLLYGDAGNDTLDGGAGNDTLDGGDGNDLFYGDRPGAFGDDGIDRFIGGDGEDTIVFSYASGNYAISRLADGSLRVNGGDILSGIEWLRFADRTLAATSFLS